jgi:hypothetical protein
MLIGGEQADADWSVRFPSIKEHSGNIPGTFREHSANPPSLKQQADAFGICIKKAYKYIYFFSLISFFNFDLKTILRS